MFRKACVFLFKSVSMKSLAYNTALMIKTGITIVHLILRSYTFYPEDKEFSELDTGTVNSLGTYFIPTL
jgi:multidrug transporter EmrE-like cation transporter